MSEYYPETEPLPTQRSGLANPTLQASLRGLYAALQAERSAAEQPGNFDYSRLRLYGYARTDRERQAIDAYVAALLNHEVSPPLTFDEQLGQLAEVGILPAHLPSEEDFLQQSGVVAGDTVRFKEYSGSVIQLGMTVLHVPPLRAGSESWLSPQLVVTANFPHDERQFTRPPQPNGLVKTIRDGYEIIPVADGMTRVPGQ